MSATSNNKAHKAHKEKNTRKNNENILIIDEAEDALIVEPPPNLNKNVKYRIHKRQDL